MGFVAKFNKKFESVTRTDWKKLFTDMSNYVFIQNNWDLARLSFLTFKNHSRAVRSNNDISYDCFGSEYDAYMGLYNDMQTFKWEQLDSASPKSGLSSLFSLK